MGKSTKFAALFTAVALAVTALSANNMLNNAVYADNAAEGYFYNQLSEDAQVFYNAMDRMDKEGVFKSGESFDLVAKGLLTSEQAEGYGSANLLFMYGAARDAFCADRADLFYVDFSYLTLRVTTDSKGEYHVYLGTGRSDSYYTEGFTDEEQIDVAIAKYEAAIDSIVAGAATVEEGKDRNAEMVKYVHDYIVDHTSYRLENKCAEGNAGFIRTAYGSIVKGEAVCEGYSRAFKAVMDRLGIPCVLVYGVYMHDKNTPEEHMWCEVQLNDGKWYAVDATMDDPISKNSNRHGIDGYESQDYLLVGSSCMDRQHYASGVMSAVEYEFVYPELSFDGYNVEVIGNYGGLTVKFKEDGEFEGTDAGIFYVSYNGMGVAKSAEKGRYFIAKWEQDFEATDEWNIGEWGYILPDVFPAMEDFDAEVRLPMPHIPYVEFAITDIPPEKYDGTNIDFSIYKGDITTFSAYSGIIYNPSGTYVKPPYVKSVTPSVSCMLDVVDKPYTVEVVYDEVLQLESEGASVGITMHARNATTFDAPCSAETYAKVENIVWHGASTVTFEFTPSRMWLDDSVFYSFNITGLVGARSGKAPIPISYCTRFAMCPCAYRSYGYDWSLYAKPTLMDSFDLDVSTWETADDEKIANELTSRMALVVSSPFKTQTDEMLKMIDEEVLSYQTFNINLTVCNAQVVKTGQKVRVHLGFPEGYGPNDAGVTFKAYHFTKDEQGNITAVDDIECIVTQYGLVILCEYFSPYAIVAVPADENTDTTRSAVLSVGEGGEVTGADSIFTLAENETKTFTITAKDGYVIDSIIFTEKNVEITDRKTMEVTVGYEDISAGVIIVSFVAETVYEAEAANGETVVAALPENTTPPDGDNGGSTQPPESGDVEDGSDSDNGNTGEDGSDSNNDNGNKDENDGKDENVDESKDKDNNVGGDKGEDDNVDNDKGEDDNIGENESEDDNVDNEKGENDADEDERADDNANEDKDGESDDINSDNTDNENIDSDNTDGGNTDSGDTPSGESSANYVSFSGYVLDKNGNPLSGVIVEIHSEVQTTTTDSNGYFKFDRVEFGAHTIYIKTVDGDVLATRSFNLVKTSDEVTGENDIVSVPGSVVSLDIAVSDDKPDFTETEAQEPVQPDEGDMKNPYTGNAADTAILYILTATAVCIAAVSLYGKAKVFRKK